MALYKLTIATKGGPVQVEGQRFSHYVNNLRFWFVVHDAHDRHNLLVVTHLDSGYRVCQVPFMTLQTCGGDRPTAARSALNELIARVGEDKVYSVLSEAEKSAKALQEAHHAPQ